MTTLSASDLVIVDSCGWIEYLGAGPKCQAYGKYLEKEEKLLLPSVIFYEVFRKLSLEKGKHFAETFLSQASAFGERLIALDLELSHLASGTSVELGLPMVDSIVYATARHFRAQLITSDAHFANLPSVTIL